MAKKAKGPAKAGKKAKGNDGPVDVVAEIAEALGDNAPKKTKGNAYLKSLVYAVADQEKFTDKQYTALSQEAKDWLNKAEAVLQKDDEAEVPEPGVEAAAEEDEAAAEEATAADEEEDEEEEDEESEDDEEESDEDEEEEDEEEEKVAKPKKGKSKKAAAVEKPVKGKGKKKDKAEKSADKPAKKKASKSSSAKAAVANKSAAEIKAAVDFAKKFADDGPCVQVRKVTDKFKGFARADVLAVADALKINRFTASRQFQVARAAASK